MNSVNGLNPFFGKFEYELSLSQIKLKIVNDGAIERGIFTPELTPKEGGETMRHTGQYIVFWHQKNNAGWKIERYLDDTEN